ncbi:MAG: type II toxin-antitoxin system PemK/MazF family toxin [Nanoarchaeota archaeon]
MIEQRDLLLVPFPFSDQSGRKVRPVIVISNNNFNNNSEDILVVGLTSNIAKDKYTINLTTNDLEEGKLSTTCCIKSENLLKIEKELAIKKIGKVKTSILKNISSKILEIIKEN